MKRLIILIAIEILQRVGEWRWIEAGTASFQVIQARGFKVFKSRGMRDTSKHVYSVLYAPKLNDINIVELWLVRHTEA